MQELKWNVEPLKTSQCNILILLDLALISRAGKGTLKEIFLQLSVFSIYSPSAESCL